MRPRPKRRLPPPREPGVRVAVQRFARGQRREPLTRFGAIHGCQSSWRWRWWRAYRSLSADLNLVPFIDFLSVCITFLLLTAVWTQISAMQVDQAVQDPNQEPPPPPDEPPTPPLTVHIRSDGIWAGREVASGTEFPEDR
jgi:hypothetical protein